jgi:hypothetical protein
MIPLRNPKAARVAITILGMGVAALSLPASAGGHGGGGGGHMGGDGGQGGGPPHPLPPLILDSGAAGRADGSNRYVMRIWRFATKCTRPCMNRHPIFLSESSASSAATVTRFSPLNHLSIMVGIDTLTSGPQKLDC